MPYVYVSVPTFVVANGLTSAIDVLVTRLKLDGAQVPGAMAEIDTAVQQVGLGFFRRLGAARIATILTNTYTDTPVTEGDFLRLMSAVVEISWVKQKLLKSKPQLFLDAGSKALQLFNDEGAFRPVALKAIQEQVNWLSHEIEDGLLALENGVQVSETELNVSTIHPKHKPDLPGATAFPARRRPPFRGYFPFGDWESGSFPP